jgi:hypothetical protein
MPGLMYAPLADVVWPALWLAGNLVAVSVISIGLVVELFFVRWLTGFGWGKAVLADIAMNAVSSLETTVPCDMASSSGHLSDSSGGCHSRMRFQLASPLSASF